MIGTKAQERREQRVAEIVANAWELAAAHGIGGLSLHALARELGIRQPSLYAYFESKHALYDAMFADGNRQLIARLDALELPDEPRDAVKAFMRAFVDFSVEDPARSGLLFDRQIPDFQPSPDSYALAETVLRRTDRAAPRRRARIAGRRRLLRRDGRRPRRRAAQQRPRRRPVDPSSRPTDRHVPRRRQAKETPPMIPDRITRPEARVLAEEEFRQFAELMGSLTADEWTRPTDCTAWDVRKMALHVLGAADAQASVREFMHQFRRGYPLNKQIDSHHWVDGINELQIREREHLTNDEIVAQLSTIGPKAVKGRWATPAPMRYLPISFGPPIGWAPLKYLLDVGFTRDVWAHRIDICAATGRECT